VPRCSNCAYASAGGNTISFPCSHIAGYRKTSSAVAGVHSSLEPGSVTSSRSLKLTYRTRPPCKGAPQRAACQARRVVGPNWRKLCCLDSPTFLLLVTQLRLLSCEVGARISCLRCQTVPWKGKTRHTRSRRQTHGSQKGSSSRPPSAAHLQWCCRSCSAPCLLLQLRRSIAVDQHCHRYQAAVHPAEL
jgi:hypothetical protein